MKLQGFLLPGLLAAALFGGLASGLEPAMAQDDVVVLSTRDRMEMQLAEYKEQLDLSEYQWSQVEAILKSGIRERVAIANRYGVGPGGVPLEALDKKQQKEMARELKDSRKETLQRMKRYLDKDKYQEFKTIQEQAHAELLAQVAESATG
jgi:hypothetical protein